MNPPNQTSEVKEGCPPPLVWHEVLHAFREDATAWTVSSSGGELSGRTLGRGSPLYFLGGFAGTHELFCLLAWLLRDSYRCVLIDYGAHRPANCCSLRNYVEELAAVRALHGDTKIDVLAVSFGSLLALASMLTDPAGIRRAILQAGFASRRLSFVERCMIRLARLCPGRLQQVPFREAISRNNHRRWFPPFDETRWKFFLEDTGRISLKDLGARAALVRDENLSHSLAEITHDVLVVFTEGDGAISRERQEELVAGLPHARREHLDNTGPAAYLTHPHRVAAAVRRFLQNEAVPRPDAGFARPAADFRPEIR
jgi:pimeloyl-ACP methyl ester carboxylesterase